MADEIEPRCYTIREYVLFKLDRNIAILGVVGIVALFCFGKVPPEAKEIALSALGILGVYIGGRGGNK
jgi:hypothetical protein